MRRPFGIRAYLGFSYALLLVLSLGAIGFLWSRNEYRVITQGVQNLMRERVSLLADIVSHELAEHGEVQLRTGEIPVVSEHGNLLAVYVDRAGTLHELAPHSVSLSQQDLFLALSNEHHLSDHDYVTLIESGAETTSVYAAAPVHDARNAIIGQVCLLMPLGELESYTAHLRLLLLFAIGVVGLLGIGISVLLTNYFSQQFSNAQGLAATVASGDYHLRIPEEGPAELRDLARYLNQMAEKLQEQLKMRQTLLANVAHELARPLAGLQLGVESLRNGAIYDPDLADELLVSMGETVRRFKALIDDITLAAQPETRPIDLDYSAVAVEPFLRGVMTRYWARAESRGIKLEVRVAPDTPPFRADEKRLNQIAGNLVDNAIKYSPNGADIRLSAEPDHQGNVCFMVRDGGDGISAEEAEHIFEPFFQGDRGRRTKQGMGLGLAIARQLAQAHGGDLTLENAPQGGTLATLTLPAADA